MPKSVRGRLDDNSPNPVDVYVGKRIRLRRRVLGLTQQEFADKLGLTFQQVQKYETAMNRVGASRLWDISRVLNVQIDYFFENMDSDTARQSPRAKSDGKISVIVNDDPMHQAETIELVTAYYKIKNRHAAQYLLCMLQELAKSVASGN
jgi:transcriptional regulator with XRE-family HTH domain